jgi:hypothetical protein
MILLKNQLEQVILFYLIFSAVNLTVKVSTICLTKVQRVLT